VVDLATGPRLSPDKLFTITAHTMPLIKPLNRQVSGVGFLGAKVASAAIPIAGRTYNQTADERTEPK
jgi:hypothetical protein